MINFILGLIIGVIIGFMFAVLLIGGNKNE